MDKNHRDTEGYPPSFSAEPAESAVSGTPPVISLGTIPTQAIQFAFDRWSIPITGGSVDVNMSSHGKAFRAGWEAAMSLARQLYDAEKLQSDPSGFRRKNDPQAE